MIIRECDINLDFNWALKIHQRCHLQDTSKPACEEYKQARQKRHKRVDEAKPLPCASYLLCGYKSYPLHSG